MYSFKNQKSKEASNLPGNMQLICAVLVCIYAKCSFAHDATRMLHMAKHAKGETKLFKKSFNAC